MPKSKPKLSVNRKPNPNLNPNGVPSTTFTVTLTITLPLFIKPCLMRNLVLILTNPNPSLTLPLTLTLNLSPSSSGAHLSSIFPPLLVSPLSRSLGASLDPLPPLYSLSGGPASLAFSLFFSRPLFCWPSSLVVVNQFQLPNANFKRQKTCVTLTLTLRLLLTLTLTLTLALTLVLTLTHPEPEGDHTAVVTVQDVAPGSSCAFAD